MIFITACDLDACRHDDGVPMNEWCWLHCAEGKTTLFLDPKERKLWRETVIHWPECKNIRSGDRVSQIHWRSVIEARDVGLEMHARRTEAYP